jgi:hypothetical protein
MVLLLSDDAGELTIQQAFRHRYYRKHQAPAVTWVFCTRHGVFDRVRRS